MSEPVLTVNVRILASKTIVVGGTAPAPESHAWPTPKGAISTVPPQLARKLLIIAVRNRIVFIYAYSVFIAGSRRCLIVMAQWLGHRGNPCRPPPKTHSDHIRAW